MKVLYLARHGETDWNSAGRLQGQTDIPLNETGRSQARLLGQRLQGLGITSVGSSDLVRARETAEIIARGLELPFRGVLEDLRERRYGLFEGLTPEECQTRYPAEWERFLDPEVSPPRGESLIEVRARMLRGVHAAVLAWDVPALIVSHGRAIRELTSEIIGQPVGPIANGAVMKLVLNDGRWVEARPHPL